MLINLLYSEKINMHIISINKCLYNNVPFRKSASDISSFDWRCADGQQRFVGLKRYIVANRAHQLYISSTNCPKGGGGGCVSRCKNATLSNYREKIVEGGGEGTLLSDSLVSALLIALTRNVKIESSEPATGTRYVRSEAWLMATFTTAHASRGAWEEGEMREKSVLT